MQTNFLSQPGSSLLGSLRGAPKHLPEIPSATQMEEQGVNLAEMNKLLLQKVEELTLYSIEMEKMSNKEKEEREKLEEALRKEQRARNVMEERLEKLEELILKNN